MRVERHDQVAILRLEAGKANAMSDAFLRRLIALCDEVGDARAAVITGKGNSFCAGLDLPSVLRFSQEEMLAFMQLFDEAMLKVWELPIPLVAALNGHAIAGGCVLALQADVRIAADRDARIGLNETQLGIGLPAVVIETLRAQVPGSSLPEIALLGKLLAPREALRLGLVHEVVADDQLQARALEIATALAALAPSATRQVKGALRRPVTEAIRARQASELQHWLSIWLDPHTRSALGAVVERLRK